VDWVPEGQTVNQVYYTVVLINLRERVRRRPEMWITGSWVLHQDNALSYNAICQEVFEAAQERRVGTSTELT
jgi:hypothetical protein